MQGKRPFDHALAVVKAVLHLTHFGGAIASLVDDYIPSATERDLKKTLEFFGERMTSLEGRVVDVDNVNKDEFAELFKSCLLIGERTHREEKLHAAANILANLLLRAGDPAKSSYEELDHLVRCVDALSIGAITVLGAARRLADSPGTQGRINFDQLHPQFSEMEPSLLMSLASELNALNLLHITEPGIQMPDYGNYALALTPIGTLLHGSAGGRSDPGPSWSHAIRT